MHQNQPSSKSEQETVVSVNEADVETLSQDNQDNQAKKSRRIRFVRHVTRRFLPWKWDPHPDHKLDNLHRHVSFPWLALSCIIIALSTVAFSWLELFLFNGRSEISNKFLKPASWLSALLSMNSIALHIALSEGVTTAWWYKASRSDTTMQELHETWKLGTSTWAVMWSGKRFNYVALATVFVATVPLNGFLLQTAITMVPGTHTNTTTLNLPLAQRLPLGFSAKMEKNSTVRSPEMYAVTSSLDGWSSLPPGVTYIGDIFAYPWDVVNCKNVDNSAVCKTKVTIPGFSINCTTSMVETYDMSVMSKTKPSVINVFNSSVTWNPASPNVINLDVKYKPNSTCRGQFEQKACEFRVAEMSLPIQINSDHGFTVGTVYNDTAWSSPVISLDASQTTVNFSVGAELPVYKGEGHGNSTYGGIAEWLKQRYDGSIDWNYDNGLWSSTAKGALASSYQFNSYIYPANLTNYTSMVMDNGSYIGQPFNPAPNSKEWCNNTYEGLDWMTDSDLPLLDLYFPTDNSPALAVYKTLNQVMLIASAMQAATNLQNNDTLDSLYDGTEDIGHFLNRTAPDNFVSIPKCDQQQDVLKYHVRWRYWSASAAITICIVLGMMPLFYGFWKLDRRTTLSPFETAAAFRAPVLEGTDLSKGAEVVLKGLGKRPVHERRPSFMGAPQVLV